MELRLLGRKKTTPKQKTQQKKNPKKRREHAKRIAHRNWGMAQQLHKFGFFWAMANFWYLIYMASLQLKDKAFPAIQSKGFN